MTWQVLIGEPMWRWLLLAILLDDKKCTGASLIRGFGQGHRCCCSYGCWGNGVQSQQGTWRTAANDGVQVSDRRVQDITLVQCRSMRRKNLLRNHENMQRHHIKADTHHSEQQA